MKRYMAGFDIFWKEYPRKVGKQDAILEWKKLRPSEELLQVILKALSWQKKTIGWKKDNGQYIVHPCRYLKKKRWEDEQEGRGQSPGQDDDILRVTELTKVAAEERAKKRRLNAKKYRRNSLQPKE